jgi:hypothetical protein
VLNIANYPSRLTRSPFLAAYLCKLIIAVSAAA